jgi:lipoprotein NlpD
MPAVRTTADHYIVRRGDTLYSIAWQHALSVNQLAGMNAIRSPYTIYTGQRLRVRPGSKPVPATPPPGPPPAAPAAARTAPQPPPAAARTAPQPPPTGKPVAAKPAPKLPAVVKHWVWPASGRLINGYNPGASGKKGIDIAGKKGQPVKAAAAGKVVYSGSGLVGYGRLIIIKHNETLLSAYGHNSNLLVSEGEYVKAGQVIANMGSSGTDRTRLYFEIRKNGKPVNPLRYLPRRS